MKNADKRFIRAEAAFEDALIRLCQSKRAAELTVSELVDTAGYSRSAFYSHYENMEDFIQSLIKREVNFFIAALDYFPPYTTQMSRLEEASIQADTELFTHVYENQALYALLLHDKLMDNTVDNIISGVVEYLLSCITWVKDGVFESQGRKWTIQNLYGSLDLSLIFRVFISVYFSLIQYWESTGYQYAPRYLAIQRMNSRHQYVPLLSEEDNSDNHIK